MPRPSFDRAAIEAEIDRLRSLDLDALRTLGCTTFQSPPLPAFTKDLIARFLCFRPVLEHWPHWIRLLRISRLKGQVCASGDVL
jgi:hypothetical protein